MLCPNCYNKIPKNVSVCSVCKFHLNELNSANNAYVKQARKEGRYDDIIYTTQFPSDLNYQKTFYMAVLGGWFGLHNFYINKTFKAMFNLGSLLLSFILSTLIFTGVLGQEFVSASVYVSILFAATLIMWVSDIIALLTKSFKVPVVLKKNIKGKKDDKK
jgi:TM2 domain-containing membrane protein YozV